MFTIDLKDYSCLPNGLISMLTNFCVSNTDGDYIPMFSQRKLILVDLGLNNKTVFSPKGHKSASKYLTRKRGYWIKVNNRQSLLVYNNSN